MTADFWMSTGYHFLDHADDGHLRVTDDFLKLYLTRPEIMPEAASCAEERRLHADLLAHPRQTIAPDRLKTLADPDMQENYAHLLRFRDYLVAQRSIESAYLGLFQQKAVPFPALFIDQLAAVILRDILEHPRSPFRARAAELLFRPQAVHIDDGQIMLADDERVEMLAAGKGYGSLGQLIQQNMTELRQIEMSILSDVNAEDYWVASDRHLFVLDLSFGRPGLDALCRVLEAWVLRLLGAEVVIQPAQTIRDERWVWHIGLDATASAIMDDLYNGKPVDDARTAQVLSLFRLEFKNPDQMLERVRGRPVYLALAMNEARRLRMKPQNLLVNLPLAPPT